MNYEELEDIIVERIKRKGVDVSVLPSVDILNAPRQTAKPQLYVIYQGSDFGECENLTVISQPETLRFEVFMRAKSRRGKMGIFDLYKEISKQLLGFKPTGAKTAITFNSFGYVSGVQNNWQYALAFSFTGYIVETDNTAPDPVKITQVSNKIKTENN